MNNLFGLTGLGLTITLIIFSIILNIILVGFVALVAKLKWAKNGDLGSDGPMGLVGDYGNVGNRGVRGNPGTLKGLLGDRGNIGDEGKIPNAIACRPFSKANNENHECKNSVLRGWSQIDWFEGESNNKDNVACVPSRISNKGKSSVVAFFGGPNKPSFSTNDCSNGSCYVGNDAFSVNKWIKEKNLPSNVRLQPGNEDERRSGRCIAGDAQITGEESAVLTNVDSSNSEAVNPDTGLPINNSGSDFSGQNTGSPIISANENEGEMYDLENQPGGAYAEGSESDPSIIIGTREKFVNSSSSSSKRNLETTRFGIGLQKEPTECTAHKLKRLWGVPEKEFGTTGNSCATVNDCNNETSYICSNNKCQQLCVNTQSRDEKGRCLCRKNDDCQVGLNCLIDTDSSREEGYCEEPSNNIWKCSKVNDKCGTLGTKWDNFGESDEWRNASNSVFVCLNKPNLEKGCTETPCWHKIRNLNESGIGSQNGVNRSKGKESKEQGLWSSDKKFSNYPADLSIEYPYENEGALIPCNDNPSLEKDRCYDTENTDWIKGTSKILTNKWAGNKTNIAKNTKGKITNYMIKGTKDLLVADPVSIRNARKNQCQDWMSYYSGRNSVLIGEEDITLALNDNVRDSPSNKNGIQPFYPGMCKPSKCIAKNRTINNERTGNAPEAPNNQRIGLRHNTFKRKFGKKYKMPKDQTTGIFKTCRCDEGHFSPNGDLTAECEQCPKGTFLSSDMAKKGFTYCLDCPPGTYQDELGKGSCKKCPPGTFQDEWGQDKCKGCQCGFKCPVVNEKYDSKLQIPIKHKINDVDFDIGRKYPVPCVPGEYCPGNNNPAEPHIYQADKYSSNTSCLGCGSEANPSTDASKSSVYCSGPDGPGACSDCPCPKGYFCPDKNPPNDIPVLPNNRECSCETPYHSYGLQEANSIPEIDLLDSTGLSKSVKKKGMGHEARCCKEGQCCDASVSSCVGSGRKNKKNGEGLGFTWPVESPKSYESHCLDYNSTLRPYNSENRDEDVYSCNYSNCNDFTPTEKTCGTGEVVSRNPDDCCNFSPCNPNYSNATNAPTTESPTEQTTA